MGNLGPPTRNLLRERDMLVLKSGLPLAELAGCAARRRSPV